MQLDISVENAHTEEDLSIRVCVITVELKGKLLKRHGFWCWCIKGDDSGEFCLIEWDMVGIILFVDDDGECDGDWCSLKVIKWLISNYAFLILAKFYWKATEYLRHLCINCKFSVQILKFVNSTSVFQTESSTLILNKNFWNCLEFQCILFGNFISLNTKLINFLYLMGLESFLHVFIPVSLNLQPSAFVNGTRISQTPQKNSSDLYWHIRSNQWAKYT